MLQYPPPPPPFMVVLVLPLFSVWFYPIYILYYVLSVVRRTQRDIYLRPLLQNVQLAPIKTLEHV